MSKHLLLIALAICTFHFTFAQSASRKPLDLVADAKRTSLPFQETNIFNLDSKTSRTAAGIEDAVKDYNLFDVDLKKLQSLGKERPTTINLQIPIDFANSLELELVQVDIFTPNFGVVKASDKSIAQVNTGLHYRGIIKGDEASIAAISIFDEQVIGLVSSKKGNLVIGKLQNRKIALKHIIYNDANVLQTLGFECHTADDGVGYTEEQLSFKGGNAKAAGGCIRYYMEVDHDIYQDKGSVAETTAFVAGLMNEVATIYANEGLQTVVSEVFVWDVPSPYSSTSSSGMLNQFKENTSSINGDLGQLLSYQASGGIAAGFSGICNPNVDNSLSFSSINSSFAVVPTFSWSVQVVSHEFGHLWGSRHTHACVWNGDNTAIDGCWTVESQPNQPPCPSPDIPADGGTIMSYCHLQDVGINFTKGFGPQPGNVLRNSAVNATCTISCGPSSCDDGFINGEETGIDCGGPECPACPTCDDGIQNGLETGVDCGGPDCEECPCLDNIVSISITFDNFPEETSWDIKSGGTVIASGGPYEEEEDRSTILELSCLVDGCYEFTIYDAFGDGICCTYGPGSYTVTNENTGAVIVTGNDFSTSATTAFCVGGTVDPTCTDGIQNGQETDVDCGGPDCPACPTCDDGIQNGEETGVDCGGPDCPACPTCDDGIQNGQETGVDCGGPDCPDCPTEPTCDDGIQNGQETGVDCGGPDCPACPTEPTCDDGIQNGEETGVDCGGPDCPACPTCDDGIQNGQETGVDCGGPDCPACPVDPTCDDGILNGEETGVDCGGPDCPACPTNCSDNSITVSITFDNFPEETSWDIRSGGNLVAAGGPYNDEADRSTITEKVCLPDGCYDFTIYDSFGDGICCTYGPGSYTVTADADGAVLAGGNNFTSSQTTNFCLGGGAEPTCDDGIQNGGETDVDCGGPDCPACPTCNDGIQNGQETGVDCGGPDCPTCPTEPTCDDGIQNGQETGVDCGGPDCPSCPTEPSCDDGIQNGQETGVDCGGPDCPSCPTEPSCDDGVQNGQETGVDCGGPDCPACPSCDDGVQNGQETGVDCGGPDCEPCSSDCTTQEIDFNDFNTTWGIWNDGGTDCRRSPSDADYAVGQTGMPVRLRDNSSSSVVTTDILNLAGYQELSVEFSYITVSMDNPSEDFWLQISTDGGSTYTTVEEWNLGDEFENEVRYSETVSIPGPFTANTKIRFRCDASTDSDQVYIDNVRISGCTGSSSLSLSGESKPEEVQEASAVPQRLNLFPNPVNRGELNVTFKLAQQNEVNLLITNLQGKQMRQSQFLATEGKNKTRLDVSQFPSGIYVLHLVTKSGRITEKFAVIK